ncbi:hypothetical protein [Nocardioides lianchengensis]|uniref:Uncharacterized protein n=1 Tax=Nocardioides lianchengensis TaxID=1045774 RepID=A0A1G6YJC7_9ACTN|nr:hypothetical protein [Nocardioides lianchengensis]NYG09645.1 vacuolar-type H+-ATPase subunit I/STV1 [Nocardioides lianchengensis]SDD89735.1 hypothetical protein SAMN05421872_11248 [Nocardioides lianchengensis]
MAPENLQAIDENDDGIVDRVYALLDHTLTITSTADARLLPLSRTKLLEAAIERLSIALQDGVGYNPGSIAMTIVDAITAAADEVADQLAQWPRTEGSDWREAVTQAASTYRRSFGQQLTQLSQELDRAKEAIEELRLQVDVADSDHQAVIRERTGELEAAIATLGAEISALDRQRATVDDQLNKSIDRAGQAISSQQQQFAEAQEKRSIEFRELSGDLVEQAEVDFQARREDAESAIAQIEQQVDEAKDLTAAFAAAGTANAFSQEAKDQAKAANTWRRAAIALGILAGLAALSLFFGNSNDPAWELVVGKLAISVAFGGVATYAASQSSRHRRREETARHLELNIVAFGPFVRDLSEVKQIEAREKVVESIFLRDIFPNGGTKEDPTLSSEQITLIGKLLEQFRK